MHPCLDDPAKHLVFGADGIVSWKTRKGKESIRVYALLRRGLVQARKAFQLEVLTHISIARGLALELETSGPESPPRGAAPAGAPGACAVHRPGARVQRDRTSADRPRPGGADAVNGDPSTYDYSHPTRTCDVVMKGGITSGVVYPHALCELARTYRFANVGGTSAGAIAAAGAAAAEHGRAHGGFEKLAALPAWIGAGDNLFRLFQPQPGTRPFFRLFTAGLGRKGAGEVAPDRRGRVAQLPAGGRAGPCPRRRARRARGLDRVGRPRRLHRPRRDRARAARARASRSAFASSSGSPAQSVATTSASAPASRRREARLPR